MGIEYATVTDELRERADKIYAAVQPCPNSEALDVLSLCIVEIIEQAPICFQRQLADGIADAIRANFAKLSAN